MLPNTSKQAAAQAQSAPIPSFSAGEHEPSPDVSKSPQPSLNSDYRQRPDLIEADLNILAARLQPRRNGLGCFTVLTVAQPEYREAVCYSERLPFAIAAGQKLRVLGRRGEYQGKPQIIFKPSDIRLVSEAADNSDLIAIDATVARISVQKPDRAWKAFRISCAGFESAAGDIAFDIHDGQRLRLRGFRGVYMGKPQLLVIHAEPLGVEFADDRRRIFTQSKIPPRYFDGLFATLGPDFVARVNADPNLIVSGLPKTKSAMRAKIKEACARIETQDAFPAALRKCGVAEPTVAALGAKHPNGLANVTAYELVDYGLLDETAHGGPRRGLTGGQADKLAQSDYAQKFRTFDPQSLERARCFAEHLARERIELRGDVGASIVHIIGDLEKRFAFTKPVTQKAIALLAEERVFTIDPSQPDRLWLTSEARAEAAVAKSVRARLARGDWKAPARRVAKDVKLFPASRESRQIQLSATQRAAAKMALENRMSIICGPPGVGKTSVLAVLVKLGGDKVLITAIAAAAVQRAQEVTGGRANTVASLTTDFQRWGDLRLSPRPDLLRGVDTLILDEASMIGSRQLATLLKGCDLAGVTRVVPCGDPDQLPPIQNGAPFADMIRSDSVPTSPLVRIFRSEAGSAVQNLVEAVRGGEFAASLSQCNGEFPDFGDGVEFLSGNQGRTEAICAKYSALAAIYGEVNVAVLSPFKGEEYGVNVLNAQLRAALGFDTLAPRVGEVLMCVRNAQRGGGRLRLLNGMRLVVTKFDGDWITFQRVSSGETATVPYKPHSHGPAETIVWGRAATVHKFQGSEAAAVIVVIPPNALRLIEKEPHIFDVANFYTGVSRAKRRVVIMGALDQLPALMKHGTRRRITTLERILTEARHD